MKPFAGLEAKPFPKEARFRLKDRIDRARLQYSLRRKLGLVSFALVSFAALVASVWSVSLSLSSSGAYQYLSLLFTDSAAAFAYFKELIYSVLESLPAFALAAALISFLGSFWAVSRLGEGDYKRGSLILTN